ncbi:glycosyltransferase involved in cell wall biosynthesis [Shewanella fodinae]|uniref:Glycosyltransferase involved in cell wall biosynthesis n=1 Tax=Shewanella fodinae TaxID=552357 RepID=A0A4R2F4M2_9GAMM|nr:glycosyltransferase involved in cell wall biosynthesis [Shewanella fodinae]
MLRDAIDIVSEDPFFDIHIVTSDGNGFLSDTKAYLHKFSYKPYQNKYVRLFKYIVAQFLLFFVLSCQLIKVRLCGNRSVVIVNTLLPFGGHIAAKLFGHKVISYIHETYLKPKLLKSFLKKIVFMCSDKVLFVSNYVRDELNINHPNGIVLYNGLRRDFLNISIDTKQKFNEKNVLFVGSLKPYKGIYSFVRLSRLLPGFNFVAILNTSDSEYKDFEIYLHGIETKNLTIVRNPSNLAEYFARAFVILNLSDPDNCVETFGLTLLEGMSFGTPVIAPPFGGPLEFVDDAVGKLIEPTNIDEIANFITYISEDYFVWENLSSNCLRRSKQYSADVYKKSFFDVLSEFI